MKILIAEDELLISEMLKEMLLDLGYQVVGQVMNYEEAIIFLEVNSDVQLVICDINFNKTKTGLDLGKILNERFEIPFIYLTSYSDDSTLDVASKTFPAAYLIKPFKISDINATLKIALAKITERGTSFIFKDGHDKVKISSKEVLFVKSENNYITIHTTKRKYTIRNSLEGLMNDFACKEFLRIHRSYLVNISKVDAILGQNIVIGSVTLPISRKYKKTIDKLFS